MLLASGQLYYLSCADQYTRCNVPETMNIVTTNKNVIFKKKTQTKSPDSLSCAAKHEGFLADTRKLLDVLPHHILHCSYCKSTVLFYCVHTGYICDIVLYK